MSSEYKLFVQRIGLIGIIQILTALSSIILLPILTKNYTVSDYGIYVQIVVSVSLIPAILTLGLPFSMMRFLAAEKDKEEIQEGFYSITAVVLITSLIGAILLYIFSEPIARSLLNNNILIAKILPFIIFFNSLTIIYLNFFRTFQRMKTYSIFLFLQTYITVLLVSYFAVSGYEISFAIIGILITQIVIFFIALTIITLNIGLKIPKFRNIKKYISLGLPTISSSLSYWIVDSSDKYIISILMGTTFVGYYSPSYALGNLIMMLVYPFNIILPPLLSRYYDEKKIEKVRIYLKFSLKYFLAFAIPSLVGLSLLSRIIIQILSTPEIASNGYFVTPFITFCAVLYGIYGMSTYVLILYKKTKIIGILWFIAAISNVLLNFILIPILGILGAAISTLVAYLIAFTISIFYSSKYFRFDFDLPFIGKSIISALIMSLIIIKFYPSNVLELLIVIGVSAIVYMTILTLLKGFQKEEIDFVKNLLK